MEKTNHQTGYHKPVKNRTTNYGPDTHSKFCRRCIEHNKLRCPMTGKPWPTKSCNV